jgi:hypothetical protein
MFGKVRNNKMAKEGTVTLATLIRGKSYKVFNEGSYVEFKRNIPVEVSDELADRLEEETETINVEGGSDVIEVDRFRIERDQQPLAKRDEDQSRRRLRLVAEDVPIRPRKPISLKKPPTGFRKPSRAASA